MSPCTPTRPLILSIFIALGACQTSHPAEPAAADKRQSSSQAFSDMDKVEAGQLKPQHFTGLNHSYKADLEAFGPVTITSGKDANRSETVTIPLAADHMITCFVARDGNSLFDVARLAVDAFKPFFANIVADGLSFEVVDDKPLIMLSMRGMLKKPKDTASRLQVAVFHDNYLTVSCLDNSPGYRKSFEKLVRTFAEGMQAVVDKDVLITDKMVAKIYVGHKPVGLSEEFIVHKPDGSALKMEYSGILVFRSASDFVVTDSLRINNLGRNGLLTTAYFNASSNGENLYDLGVVRGSAKTFVVKGSFGGKPFATTLTSQLPEANEFETLKKLKAAAREGTDYALVDEIYDPEADPTKLLRFEAKMHANVMKVAMEGSKAAYQSTLDHEGMLLRSIIGTGKTKVLVKRIYPDVAE